MGQKILFLAAFFLSGNAFSFTECNREVENVWISFTPAESVFVTFKDGHSWIYKDIHTSNEQQKNRFFSQALAAQTAGKILRIRYPEDDLVCPPKGAARHDFEGVWILGGK